MQRSIKAGEWKPANRRLSLPHRRRFSFIKVLIDEIGLSQHREKPGKEPGAED